MIVLLPAVLYSVFIIGLNVSLSSSPYLILDFVINHFGLKSAFSIIISSIHNCSARLIPGYSELVDTYTPYVPAQCG